jgi:hypothetical protein
VISPVSSSHTLHVYYSSFHLLTRLLGCFESHTLSIKFSMHSLGKESIHLYDERGHVGWRLECRLECTELCLIIELAFKKAPSIYLFIPSSTSHAPYYSWTCSAAASPRWAWSCSSRRPYSPAAEGWASRRNSKVAIGSLPKDSDSSSFSAAVPSDMVCAHDPCGDNDIRTSDSTFWSSCVPQCPRPCCCVIAG